MSSDDLSTEQAQRVRAEIVRMMEYLGRLRTRMEKRGFPGDDRLYRQANEAYNALHKMAVELRYLSCQSGVGRRKGALKGWFEPDVPIVDTRETKCLS